MTAKENWINNSYLISRSAKETVTEIVSLDIDISDFFVLNHFRSEGNESDILHRKFRFSKVLLTGEIGKDILAHWNKNRGLN